MAAGYKGKIRALRKNYEKGKISEDVYKQKLGEWVARGDILTEGDKNKQAGEIWRALDKAGYSDPQEIRDWPTQETDPDTGEPVAPGEGMEWLSEMFADPAITSMITGKYGASNLMAMAMADAVKGRGEAVEMFEDQLAGLDEDELFTGLEDKAMGLLEQGDVLSEQDLQEQVSGMSAKMAQSYQNQSAGLQNTLGGRGIDPGSAVAQSLAGNLRFRTLQQTGQNQVNIQTQGKLINRKAVEDAIRLGTGVSGYTQGVRNQMTANIANLLAGQGLAKIGTESAATSAALAAHGPGGPAGASQGVQYVEAATPESAHFSFAGGG